MSERLEESKEILNEYIQVIEEHFGCPPSDIKKLNYLVEQAERVAELEQKNKNLNREIGLYSNKVGKLSIAVEELGTELKGLANNMNVPKQFESLEGDNE